LERLKEKGAIDYSIYVTRLTGVGDIIPHQRYEDVTEAVWSQATQSIEQYRFRFASEFLHVETRDLAVGGVFLTIRRR
jgi:chitinase